jgi:siderophore synthetase component
MILEDIFERGPLSLIRMEQTVNNGSPSGFTDRYTTSSETAPGRTSLTRFELPELKLHSTSLAIDLGARPKVIANDNFFVHPDMLAKLNLGTIIGSRTVYPTSSARTVRASEDEGYFIKLAYRGLIGRMPRDLGRRQANSAIEVSRIIESALIGRELDAPMYILREPFARVVVDERDKSGYEWGYVLRESKPFPVPPEPYALVPGFSLFGSDAAKPNDKPLLSQMISNSGGDPLRYLLDRLLIPTVDAYFAVLLKCGLQLEAHAQNTLFLIDSTYNPIGVVVRDAESIDKDLDLISTLGLPTVIEETSWKCLRREQYNYQIMHSFMFDFKLGEYLLEPLVKVVIAEFGVNEQLVYEEVKARSEMYMNSLPDDFFPRDEWFSYERIVHDRSRQREYVSTPSPKFRPR